MIVPDLSLLVYAHSTGAPLHEPARRWWEDLVNGTERVGVPWLVAAGFVRLLTHPNVLNTPAAPEHAVDLMAEWFRSPSVTPLNPGTQHIAIFIAEVSPGLRSARLSLHPATAPLERAWWQKRDITHALPIEFHAGTAAAIAGRTAGSGR